MNSTLLRWLVAVPVVALLVVIGWLLIDRSLAPDPDTASTGIAVTAEETAPAADLPGKRSPDADRAIFQDRMEWARAERLDTLPVGEIVARVGRTFVGTTYTPGTLDPPGPERLVVNLRELDCVTFIENVLALSLLIRRGEFDDFEAFKEELVRIRYRDGEIAGYPSRLHYFSEWISNAEEKGLVRNITRELGGVRDAEPIRFMSSHADAYRQLSSSDNLAAIRRIERGLSERARYYIPETRIAAVEEGIRDGDIIAATSSLDGLDVAHTGIAVWIDDRLHLMHAPLVGKDVEISELPLAERIQRIDKQDGIMVARPT